MNLTVIRIGNSAGVVLPKDIREDNDIHIGDKVSVLPTQEKGKLLIAKQQKTKKSRKVTTKFAQMVDEFMTEHEDVLRTLAEK